MEGNQQLFERLLKADTEAEVIRTLKDAGYWDDPEVWRFYGDQPENWATVGNQQSRAEQALIEKTTNSIDTKLCADCARDWRRHAMIGRRHGGWARDRSIRLSITWRKHDQIYAAPPSDRRYGTN